MELHAAALKIPEDGAESTEPSDAEHHVICFQGDRVAVDGKALLPNVERNCTRETTASDAISIGDHHMGTAAVQKLQVGAGGC